MLEAGAPQEDLRVMESHLNHTSKNKVYRVVSNAGQEKEEVKQGVTITKTTIEKKTEEKEQIQNMLNDEEPTEKSGEVSEPSEGWVGADSEFLLPAGWRYRWVRTKSAKSKTGFQRALHFRTEVGSSLRSSNEAFRYMVENDFAEEDQENLRAFVQSSKLEEKKKNSLEIKMEEEIGSNEVTEKKKNGMEIKTEPVANLEDNNVEEDAESNEATDFVMEGLANLEDNNVEEDAESNEA